MAERYRNSGSILGRRKKLSLHQSAHKGSETRPTFCLVFTGSHYLQATVEVKKKWSYNSNPQYACIPSKFALTFYCRNIFHKPANRRLQNKSFLLFKKSSFWISIYLAIFQIVKLGGTTTWYQLLCIYDSVSYSYLVLGP
jgi:hypothetical protein